MLVHLELQTMYVLECWFNSSTLLRIISFFGIIQLNIINPNCKNVCVDFLKIKHAS